MKQSRNVVFKIAILVLFLELMTSSTSEAAFLDIFKSPSDLIMNQKNCTFMKGLVGQVVNGRFVLASAGVVVMSMEKLDDDRVLARMEQEDRKVLVLQTKESKGAVTATHVPSALLVLECLR
jgi:hypothetical protein